MENLVTISNVKENIVEFDIEVEGISSTDIDVRFVIEAKTVCLGFDAKNEGGNKWSVTIPPLSILERATYQYRIDAVIDGYFFEPLTGTVNVVGTHDLYISRPKNTTVAPLQPEPVEVKAEKAKKSDETKKEVEKQEEKKEATKTESISTEKKELFATIAKIIETTKPTEVTSTEPVKARKPTFKFDKLRKQKIVETVIKEAEKTTEPTSQDKAVKAILEDLQKDKKTEETKKVTTVPFAKKDVVYH